MSRDEKRLVDFLRQNGSVVLIRFHWVDFSGVLRTRIVPIKRCLEIARGKDTYSLAQNCMIIPISTAPECFPTGKGHERWHLIPDWSSVRLSGCAQGHAAVMCFVDQQNAETRFGKCPRSLLYRSLEDCNTGWNAEFLMGFEIEFVLLDETNQLFRPMDALNGYSRTAGLRSETLTMVDEIVDALSKSSIDVHHVHTETTDQLEIAIAPQSPLNAIDSVVYAQEIIRTICIRYKLRATMTPKPVLDADGPHNGSHLHLSIANVEHSDYFLAGILMHMESLCAFGMANYDSYVRTVDDGVGTWIGWSTDQRDLPVRGISKSHWEFRMLDSTSNPYMFVASVILAGTNGLRQKTPLIWKDCSVFLRGMNAEQRSSFNIEKAMPTSLQQSLTNLKENTTVKEWVGSEILEQYIAIKEREVLTFGKMSDEQRRVRFLEYF